MKNLTQTTPKNYQILPSGFDKLRSTYSLEEDRLLALKQLLPEAFADGKINFEVLRELLGDKVEDERDEHFGLSWTGKKEARRLAGLPSKGTLAPAPGEGFDEATTENIFIEGDNLEVLKLLHKSYRGRIKMIYIDPPYNTGNDFIYKDDYREPLESYLVRSGQMTDAGELLSSNSKGDGRFHSNWLNMIYPRIRIAKDLLCEDGVIFVSIDDNEVQNLKYLMNEVFGEENFIEQIIWKNKYGAGAKTKGFIGVHEYILCYSKFPISNIETPLSEEEMAKYKMKDSKFATRGGYVTQPLSTTSMDTRENLIYSIPYNGKEILPEKQWVWSKERTLKALANDELVINEKEGNFSVRFKQYLKDENGVLRKGKPVSILNGPFTQEGTEEINQLFNKAIFDFPKPSSLIKYLFSTTLNGKNEKDGIYLDFFCGSGSTAQAIMNLNHEDKGTRKFICVQIPEDTNPQKEARKAGYKKISEVTKERIRRAIKKIKNKQTGNSSLLQRAENPDEKQDLGFKVFRLEHSNFRAWTDFTGQEFSDFRPLLESAETPFVAGATNSGILNEILLLEGFPLNSTVTPDIRFKRNQVYCIESEFSEHRLFITLDEEVWEETIDNASELDINDIFICLDNSLNDESKVRLADVCRLKTI